MSYETDNLKNAVQAYLYRQESDQSILMHRIHVLELFMQRAEPYIKAMELIDSKPTEPYQWKER